jgi:formylglycine-generating enzyme required for sulfatase activity
LEVFNSEIKSNGPLGGYLDQNQPISISKTPVTGSSAPELRVSTFSISMWIKPRTLDRVSEWLYLIEATGGPTLRIGSTTTSFQDHYKNIDFMARSPLIADFKENEWQHLVVTHDKGKSVFYLNGGEVFNATTSIAYFDINNFIIGNGGGFKYFFDGGLDEIRIYNRALSPEDVAFLCDKESGKSEMVFVKRGTLPQGSELAGQEVASFLVSRFETTWSEWKKVREWAASNGYDIGEVGQGISNSHPVVDVNWYEAVKWCNAKSQMEGLVPVYTFNTQIFKAGEGIPSINPAANGYRLLNEAEWEWVARGATQSIGYVFSGSNDINRVGWYNNNSGLKVNPVAGMAPNEIGIFDMTGNVWEWCWDLYDPQSSTGGPFANPRRIRGGSWGNNVGDCAVAYRGNPGNPGGRDGSIGFRYARNFEQPIFSETAGTYIGNFGAADLEEPAAALLRNGQVLITLQANRQFTGALVFNGQKVGFRGRFDEDGNWSGAVTVARRLVEIELFLEAGELGNRVSCLVVFNGEESTAFVLLPTAHTGAKGDVFGWNGARLNVLLESTGSSGKRFGHGFAGATCAKDGVLRFAGRLADNTAWSGAARVVRDEGGDLRLPLALPLNATKGLLHGEGTLDPAADVRAGEAEFFSVGTWTWVRGADARAKAHKEGFVETLQPFGQRWSYRRGTNPWTGQTGETGVQLMLGMEAGAPGALGPFTTAWPLNNRPVWSPIPPRGFQFTATTARGEFSGKIPARGGGVVIPATSYRGVLLTPGVARGDGILLGGGFLAGSESSEVVELTDPDP